MNGRSRWARAVVVLVIVSWAGQVPASAAPQNNGSDPACRWPYGPVGAVAEAGGQLVFGSGCVLTIADVSGIETLRVVAEVALPDVVRGVDVVDGYAYVADGRSGLRIIDVSTPSDPVELGVTETPFDARDVAVSGSHAYVADIWAGLRIIDISIPAWPIETAVLETPASAYRVAVSGGYAFVADLAGCLHIIDVRTPASPVAVGLFDTVGIPFDVTIADGLAYVADSQEGLVVIDVGTPSSPYKLSSVATPGRAIGGFDLRGVRLCCGRQGRFMNSKSKLGPIAIASIMLLFAAHVAFAQVDWTVHQLVVPPGNPGTWDPGGHVVGDVVFDGTIYHMYLVGGEGDCRSKTRGPSGTGSRPSRCAGPDPGNPVLNPGPASGTGIRSSASRCTSTGRCSTCGTPPRRRSTDWCTRVRHNPTAGGAGKASGQPGGRAGSG